MAVAEHLVASTRGRVRTLTSYEHGAWLWTHLLEAMPDAVSLVLMRDHIHLVARPGCTGTFRRVLAAFSGVFGVRFDLCPAQPATSLPIAARQIRYGFNNPVRAGYVDDPWKWPWSTLRELGRAAFPPRHRLDDLAAFLHRTPQATLRGLTYCNLRTFSSPRLGAVEVAALGDIVAAVGAALRLPKARVHETRVGRRLIVQASAALAQPPRTTHLASLIGIDPRSVRRLRTPRHEALDAAMVCLADPRLRELRVA